LTFLVSRANASHPPGGVALISMFESFLGSNRVRRRLHGIHTDEECQFGWMRLRRCEWLGSHPQQAKNGSYELAVVALSTHSGE